MYEIYKLTCPNGKIYVGQTTEGLPTRLRKHNVAAQMGITTEMCDGIRKHGGIEKFEVELLESFETQQEADVRERYWIKELDTIKPNGYNTQSGGRVDKDRCVEDAEVTAATVDRDSLPLYINFVKDSSRGYHSFAVRDKAGKLGIPEKTFRSGTKSLDETLQEAEKYLEQYVPRNEWIYENKMAATRSAPKFEPTPGPNADEENARLPQCMYYSEGKGKATERPYYMIMDSKKVKRFKPMTFRAGKKSIAQCKKEAEEYLETIFPRDEWQPKVPRRRRNNNDNI